MCSGPCLLYIGRLLNVVVRAVLPDINNISRRSDVTFLVEPYGAEDGVELPFTQFFGNRSRISGPCTFSRLLPSLNRAVRIKRVAFRLDAVFAELFDDRCRNRIPPRVGTER